MTKTIEFTGRHRDRAVVAFAKTEGAEAMHKITHSYTRKYHDLRYVLLTERNQVAAVYRVQQDNSLRRLRRWPPKLNDAFPKIKPKTRDRMLQERVNQFMKETMGNGESANKLMDQWLGQINELQCCDDHAHELAGLSPREIQEGIAAGYLKKPLCIDTIREYKARYGY